MWVGGNWHFGLDGAVHFSETVHTFHDVVHCLHMVLGPILQGLVNVTHYGVPDGADLMHQKVNVEIKSKYNFRTELILVLHTTNECFIAQKLHDMLKVYADVPNSVPAKSLAYTSPCALDHVCI